MIVVIYNAAIAYYIILGLNIKILYLLCVWMFLNGRIREGGVVMKRARELFNGLSVTIFHVFVVGNNLYFFS